MMKATVVFALLFCAAFAAPAEDLKAVEAAEDAPEEQVVLVADAVVGAPEDAPEDVAEGRSDICPSGWDFHGSRCHLFVNTYMNWYSAEEHCNSLGAHLASPTNPTEYSFLQQMTRTRGLSTAWLGGFYLQGRWLWAGRQQMYYENWYSKSTSYSSNSCVFLYTSYGWRNYPCSNTFNFICSKAPFSH